MIKNNADFVHFHCHTEYSRFDGLAKMGDFVPHARKMGFRALAISDHGNVGGWIKFYQQCKTNKIKKLIKGKYEEVDFVDDNGNPVPPIKPIFGQEFYLARNHLKIGKEGQPDGRKGNRHILLIAKNEAGYKNLCRLSQKAWTDGQYIDPRTDLYELAKHSEGIICSTACLGSVVNYNLYTGRYAQARKAVTILKDIFGEDLYLATMFHGIDAERLIIPDQIRLGKELGVDVCAENDSHYVRKDQARSQEVLMATSTSKCMKDPKRIHFPHDEFYLKSAAEMSIMYGHVPEVLTNTVKYAERVEDFLKLGGMRLPDFGAEEVLQKRERIVIDEAVKADVPLPKNVPAIQLIEELAWEGMVRLKWDQSPPHVEAYKKELRDMGIAYKNNNMDFFTYFLIDWDIKEFAVKNNIARGCGRGSGFGSIILRCLGITYGPDPLKYGLLWERFLAFDDAYILLDSDWGFPEEEVAASVDVLVEATSDIEDERAVEDDQGGVDRY